MSSIKAKFRILEQEPIKAVFKVNAVIPADDIQEQLNNEISRAIQAENQLQDQINTITGDIDDISEELTTKADKSNTYTKAETNNLLAQKQPIGDYATNQRVNIVANNLDALTGEVENIAGELDSKQDKLVSSQNIKTVNGESILGSGNIEIQSGGASSFAELEGSPYDNEALANELNSLNIISLLLMYLRDSLGNNLLDKNGITLLARR